MIASRDCVSNHTCRLSLGKWEFIKTTGLRALDLVSFYHVRGVGHRAISNLNQGLASWLDKQRCLLQASHCSVPWNAW